MPARERTLVVFAIAALLAAGCGGAGRPKVAVGQPCAACAMTISDLRFASVMRAEGRWKSYDAIECVLREPGAAAGVPAGDVWLSDYDSKTLHPADSMWVVKGEFPSPMGGGFAAFSDRAAAEAVAAETRGSVGRLAGWIGREAR